MTAVPIIATHVRAAAEREVLSARPGAPVVSEPSTAARRPRLGRTRAGLAGALRRMADRVAPAPACGTASWS